MGNDLSAREGRPILRGTQRYGNLFLSTEVPARDCHNQCAHWFRNDKEATLYVIARRLRRGNLVQELLIW